MTGYPGYIPPAAPTIAGVPGDWTRGQFLAYLVDRNGWRRGAEIGVSYGDTLRHLMQHCPALHMIGADTWTLNPAAPEPPDWTVEHQDNAKASADAIAREYSDRCVLLQGESVAMAERVAPGTLDFVWIDGDHSTAACTADIAAWLPALKPGGWILGHDINWPTVKAAVDAALPGYLVGPDSVWFRPLHPVPSWWVRG